MAIIYSPCLSSAHDGQSIGTAAHNDYFIYGMYLYLFHSILNVNNSEQDMRFGTAQDTKLHKGERCRCVDLFFSVLSRILDRNCGKIFGVIHIAAHDPQAQPVFPIGKVAGVQRLEEAPDRKIG